VRRVAFDIAVVFVGATVVATYAALEQPGLRGLVLHLYVLLVGALTMFALVTATSEALPRRARSDFERALAERSPPDRALPEIEKMQREVTLATASAYDLHYRLLPHLREIARARCERRGRRPGPELLGRWWELLRPDREPPEERFSGGMKVRELRECLEDLERI